MIVPFRTLSAAALMMLGHASASRSAETDTRTIDATTYLRTGPGIDERPTDEALSGRVVDVLSCERNWCRVRYGDQTGWVPEGALVPVAAPAGSPALETCFVGPEAGRREGRDVRFCHADPARP